MSFDWPRFLSKRGIAFRTSGGNVAKDNIVVHCPYCGSADEGQHMEISTTGRGWRCFRRPRQHYGRNPIRLVQAILGCSYEASAAITGQTINIPNNIVSTVNALIDPPKPIMPKPLKMPAEFKPFDGKPSSRLFVKYLLGRHFTESQIKHLTDDFGIRYCTSGPYKGRIIFPVYYQQKLMTWTGRTVYPSEQIRYKALSTNIDKAERENMPPACGPITDYLLWYDDLKHSNGSTLVLCEGPFDSLRLHILGRKVGIDSTCCFTSHPSKSQISLLGNLADKYRYRYILLDQGMLGSAISAAREMAALDFKVKQLPDNVKDPGELTERSFSEMEWKL